MAQLNQVDNSSIRISQRSPKINNRDLSRDRDAGARVSTKFNDGDMTKMDQYAEIDMSMNADQFKTADKLKDKHSLMNTQDYGSVQNFSSEVYNVTNEKVLPS